MLDDDEMSTRQRRTFFKFALKMLFFAMGEWLEPTSARYGLTTSVPNTAIRFLEINKEIA